MASEGSIVLNYHDSLLRSSDFDTLREGSWLNDNVIAFIYEYFERVTFVDHSDKISFISPDVTQFIKFASAEEVSLFLEPLSLEKKEFIFMVINDNSSAESAGGAHWSCLFCNRSSRDYFHFDSLQCHNTQPARQVAKALAIFLKDPSPSSVKDIIVPQQTNSCDCGVYAVCFTEIISKQLLAQGRFFKDDLESLTPQVVNNKRKELRDLIKKLALDS